MFTLTILKSDAHKAAGVLLANLGSCNIVHGEENSTVIFPDKTAEERGLQVFEAAGIFDQK